MEQLADSAGLDVLARLFGLVKILVKAELERTPKVSSKTKEKR